MIKIWVDKKARKQMNNFGYLPCLQKHPKVDEVFWMEEYLIENVDLDVIKNYLLEMNVQAVTVAQGK